jgi:CarboxypepD_reg-like domain
MRFVFVFIISFFSGFFSYAQTNSFVVVSGKVVDDSKKALANVTVLVINSSLNTVSNANGLFEIKLPKQNTILKFQLLGYKTVEKSINPSADTINLKIILTEKNQELQAVEILYESIQMAYDRPYAYVFDYEFYGDGLLLLLEENKKSKLRLVDQNNDVITHRYIRKNPGNFYRDCLGNIGMIYSDSTYQIYITDTILNLAKGVKKEKFELLLTPCAAFTGSHFYFRVFGPYSQSILYYAIDSATKQRTIIKRIADVDRKQFADSYFSRVTVTAGYAPREMGDIDYSALDFIRQNQSNEMFLDNIVYRPIYSPLLEINDSIFIFDHSADTCFVYTKRGLFSRQFPVKYHHNSGWKRELIVSYDHKKVYAKFIRDGITYLDEINLATGKVIKEYKLKVHPFIKHVKVRDGYAYYLYMDWFSDGMKYLFRQYLN